MKGLTIKALNLWKCYEFGLNSLRISPLQGILTFLRFLKFNLFFQAQLLGVKARLLSRSTSPRARTSSSSVVSHHNCPRRPPRSTGSGPTGRVTTTLPSEAHPFKPTMSKFVERQIWIQILYLGLAIIKITYVWYRKCQKLLYCICIYKNKCSFN